MIETIGLFRPELGPDRGVECIVRRFRLRLVQGFDWEPLLGSHYLEAVVDRSLALLRRRTTRLAPAMSRLAMAGSGVEFEVFPCTRIRLSPDKPL